MNRLFHFVLTLMIIAVGIETPKASAAESGVAKVMIIKGQAEAKMKDGKIISVKKDQWIKEGAILKTSSKSFVKLLFIDKSQMNLGPESQMEIAKFPKQEAGVINLVTGSLRAKVTKDYMDNKDTDKSKLIIKTKTAAMGVRGTDFQVSFDPSTASTSLDVWEGQVMMANIDPSQLGLASGAIDNLLNNDGVAVKEGTEATADPKSSAPPEVKPMPQDKVEAGKSDTVVSNSAVAPKDEIKAVDGTKPTTKGATTRDVTPPGVSKSAFANTGVGAAGAMKSVIGSAAVLATDKVVAKIEESAPVIARSPGSVESDITPLAPPPIAPTTLTTSTGGTTTSTAPAALPLLNTDELQNEITQTIVQQQTQSSNTIIQNNVGVTTTTDVTFSVNAQ